MMPNKGRWSLCLNMNCPKKAQRQQKKDEPEKKADAEPPK
jgi:hypothetical protein